MTDKVHLDDLLDTDKSQKKTEKGRLNRFLDKLAIFRHDIYDIKVPLALCATTETSDRYLTYIIIKSGVGSEGNPMALAFMQNFGVVPGMLLSGLAGLAAYAVSGSMIDSVANGAVPRNSFVKAALYGVGASEALVTLNNYFVWTQSTNSVFNQIAQNYGESTLLNIFLAIPMLCMAATAGYYAIKNTIKAHRAPKNASPIA